MKCQNLQVEALRKVTLHLYAGCSSQNNPCPAEATLDFIFGLGKDGLAPIEREIAGKAIGSTIHVELPENGFYPFFGHIPLHHISLPSADEIACLKIKITNIEIPSAREVISAMAAVTPCGDGCGCGCGGHD